MRLIEMRLYADVCISDDAMHFKSRKYGGAELLVNEDYGDAYDMGHSTLRTTSETVTNA